ncbi:MAG: signal recognition particle protein [Holosporales bacterium]|nr:signal recognition particle protein [Holosporales bacterium]
MFSNLSKKLMKIFDGIRGRGILTQDIIDSTIREIRISLLEADVALSVARSFTENLKETLKGEKVIGGISPEQTIIKAVYDELVRLLGTEMPDLQKPKSSVLIAGLQGSGKTTTSAKLAKLFKEKFKKSVLLVSLDTYRPAAIEQLKKLAYNNNIDFFDNFDNKDDPLLIAQKANNIKDKYDIVIYDTAGRLYLDEKLMEEIKNIKNIISPQEIILVIDSMMGQDALNTAKSFNENLSITGLILTRIDGDSRGGAALSAKYVTNCQIKYICTGEKVSDIEIFHPERIASRILDKGDVISLVEKALDENVIADIKDIAIGKDFDLNGMEKYIKQLEKLGGIGGFLKFIPGMGKIKEQLQQTNINDKTITRQLAIIKSMTNQERKDPKILNGSRRKRIALGCGQPVSEVNKLIKQFEGVKHMMSKFSSPGIIQQMTSKLK